MKKEAKHQLLSVSEAAEYLNMSKKFIYKSIYERTIPHVKIGRRIRIKVSDLDEIIEKGYVPTRGK